MAHDQKLEKSRQHVGIPLKTPLQDSARYQPPHREPLRTAHRSAKCADAGSPTTTAAADRGRIRTNAQSRRMTGHDSYGGQHGQDLIQPLPRGLPRGSSVLHRDTNCPSVRRRISRSTALLSLVFLSDARGRQCATHLADHRTTEPFSHTGCPEQQSECTECATRFRQCGAPHA
ncbi:hypothetical protein K466DRAFT_342866 [Polyporus arcularius HHB13444]|uniref:Uncharacterized protein n=1 Tax=Polyporus arcularius HHB13444 TaxID=1314778 RepID=A0A5C3PRA4_9APHY|nr:hypothetical protein K466DRAFT_342866 [Polyporus arcularius HHB13444]